MRPEGGEVDQVPWRRAILVLLVALAAIPLSTLLQDSWTKHPSDEDIAEAKEIVAAGRPYELKEIKRCEADPGSYSPPSVDHAARSPRSQCEEMLTTHYEDLLEAPSLDLDAVRRDVTTAAITLLIGLMMLIGTTFVGHSVTVGYRGYHLVFERGRLRVWLAKALAVTAATTVAGVVVLSLSGPSCPEVYIPEDYEAASCTRHITTWDGEPYLGVVLVVAVALSLWSLHRHDVP